MVAPDSGSIAMEGARKCERQHSVEDGAGSASHRPVMTRKPNCSSVDLSSAARRFGDLIWYATKDHGIVERRSQGLNLTNGRATGRRVPRMPFCRYSPLILSCQIGPLPKFDKGSTMFIVPLRLCASRCLEECTLRIKLTEKKWCSGSKFQAVDHCG